MIAFIIPYPEQLRQSETREHGICSKSQDSICAKQMIDGIDLLLAALVAPDQRGTDHPIGRIQHDKAVHLPGKSDAAHGASGKIRL